MNEKYVWKNTGQLLIGNIKPSYNITFHRDGQQVGALDFNGPEMTFTGDMDESAKLFFDWIAESFKERLKQERNEEREQIIAKNSPEIEHMNAYIKELERQAARYKVLRTWDLGGYDYGLYSPEEVDKAVDDCIKEDT